MQLELFNGIAGESAICPECGIALEDDVTLGVYSASTLQLAHRRGVCVACLSLLCRYTTRIVEPAASTAAHRNVWGGLLIGSGLGRNVGGYRQRDEWPLPLYSIATARHRLRSLPPVDFDKIAGI